MKVNLCNLEIQRGHFTLGPLNFEFQENGLYWIQGKNGAGKTTLLKTLLGRIRPSAGSFMAPPEPIGTVGLEGALVGCWTVEENWHWIQRLMKSRGLALKAALQPFSKMRFDQLSQGMKRQVELLMILSLPFQTRLLDEPLAPLDATKRTEFSELICQASKSSLILMTSHQKDNLDPTYSFNLEMHP